MLTTVQITLCFTMNHGPAKLRKYGLEYQAEATTTIDDAFAMAEEYWEDYGIGADVKPEQEVSRLHIAEVDGSGVFLRSLGTVGPKGAQRCNLEPPSEAILSGALLLAAEVAESGYEYDRDLGWHLPG